MSEQIEVTPVMIKWAREKSGLSISDVSEKYKKIREWEDGISFPTYPQLESLSDTFKVPIAVFFFPSPPEMSKISESFRTLPESEYENLPSKIHLLLRKAKAFQLNLIEMYDGRNPAKRNIIQELTVKESNPIADIADAVRKYIGVSVSEQRSWKNSEEALKNWRDKITSIGVNVFKDAFKNDEFSGFCLYDKEFPLIYVNNSSSKNRQIFTLFHELAHLLFHTSGIDKNDDDYIDGLRNGHRHIEVLCNKFAAEFLLPEDELNEFLGDQDYSENKAYIIANQFNVSRELVFRKFLEKGHIDNNDYYSAVSKWNKQIKKEEAGGNHYWTKLSYLGRDYVSTALRRFHQNYIDEYKLADYLDTKPKNVSVLEEYFLKGAV